VTCHIISRSIRGQIKWALHSWQGTATALLAALEDVARKQRLNTRAQFWPKAPNALSRKLREAEPALLSRGIRIDFGKSGSRCVTLERLTENTVPIVPIALDGPETTPGGDSKDDSSWGTARDTVSLGGFQPTEGDADGWDDLLRASQQEFEERAAILEFDGGISRDEAERIAREIGQRGHRDEVD